MENGKIRVLSEAEKLFMQADERLQEGMVSVAYDLFFEITQRFPDFGRAYDALGLLYFKKFNDIVSAEACFKKSIALAPEYTPAYLHYAQTLLAQERFTELLATLNKVLEIPGVKKDEAFLLFGSMNELQGKYDDAMGYFKRAIVSSLSEENIADAEKAISRCISKKKYSDK